VIGWTFPASACTLARRVTVNPVENLIPECCPRCGEPDPSSRFYGPCTACRDELGHTLRLDPIEVEKELYVPKMNVVPNHVATKE